MNLLLAVTGWDPKAWAQRIRALLPDRDLVTPATTGNRSGIRYGLAWRHPPGAFADLPNLEAIFSLGAGVDHVLADPGLPDVAIVRVVDPDLTGRMSEWVVLQTLLHARQFRRYDDQQQRRIWGSDDEQPAANDVRVGILGLGVLGCDAAQKLKAIGFDVAGWSRSERRVAGMETFHGAVGLDRLLARTDILISLLPLTAETRGLLDRDLIGKLARDGRLGGPFLINGGRGGSQVEADILAALRSGALRGASLDVFETEPLPAASPLWEAPNLFISPHNAAISEPQAIARYIASAILAFERGEPLPNVVDRKRGY
jgi:glyoxylate/hydroxypyruvate reductase A